MKKKDVLRHCASFVKHVESLSAEELKAELDKLKDDDLTILLEEATSGSYYNRNDLPDCHCEGYKKSTEELIQRNIKLRKALESIKQGRINVTCPCCETMLNIASKAIKEVQT